MNRSGGGRDLSRLRRSSSNRGNYRASKASKAKAQGPEVPPTATPADPEPEQTP
ncbi:hypothetical protein ACIBEA_32790 [Streptomyces sp. NPDC051555]|uniref:hypothetical protein n=1 Tax=Streptomyces sp. NPDC051555 TaxID=3365657 RepID=UPI00379A9A26